MITRSTSEDLVSLTDQLSGLTDMELTIVAEALNTLNVDKLGLDEYTVFRDLRDSVEALLTYRAYDPASTLEYCSGPTYN